MGAAVGTWPSVIVLLAELHLFAHCTPGTRLPKLWGSCQKTPIAALNCGNCQGLIWCYFQIMLERGQLAQEKDARI